MAWKRARTVSASAASVSERWTGPATVFGAILLTVLFHDCLLAWICKLYVIGCPSLVVFFWFITISNSSPHTQFSQPDIPLGYQVDNGRSSKFCLWLVETKSIYDLELSRWIRSVALWRWPCLRMAGGSLKWCWRGEVDRELPRLVKIEGIHMYQALDTVKAAVYSTKIVIHKKSAVS